MAGKVVFFDMFDTLVHPDRGYLEPYFTREIDRMGDSGELRTADETISEMVRVAGLNGRKISFDEHSQNEMSRYYEQCMYNSITSVDPKVLQMLSDLKSDGYKLCVISDAAHVDIAGWNKSPLFPYFDDAVFSCDVGHVKPEIELYEIAKRRMGNPARSIFVGDGGHDELQGAKQAGMTTVKVEWLKCRNDKSIYDHADFVADTPDKLITCVNAVDFEKADSQKKSRKLPSMGEDLLMMENQISHMSNMCFDYM